MALDNICNYIQLTENIATSGQPIKAQLKEIAEAGHESVINLAMHDSDNSIKDEENLVTFCGVSYIHIPVPFDNPTVEHLNTFERTMTTLFR